MLTSWVDRLSNRLQLLKCKRTDPTFYVANAFFANIFKLRALQDNIVSSWDGKFKSELWERLMKMSRVQLKFSSSCHPPTDGASDIMNRWWKLSSFLLFIPPGRLG